jgi:hypothetical protein
MVLAGALFWGAALEPGEILFRGEEQQLDPSSISLPAGAIELKRVSRFPEAEGQGPYLSQPEGLALAPTGRIYISDTLNNEIYTFDLAGCHMGTFGRTGQGPGEFLKPGAIAISDGHIIVREAGSMRIQIFDLLGKYLSGFKTFRAYTSMAADNKRIYASPFLHSQYLDTKEACLVDVLDFNGRILPSFGAPLDIANKGIFPWLNQVILSFGRENELWVAFKCFPIVRKYAADGRLLAEFHYRYDIAEKKAALNRKIGSEGNGSAAQPFFAWVIQSACATRRGLYLIDGTAGHRVLIFLIGDDGRVSEFYWAPLEKRGLACSGLLVMGDEQDRKFYVLNHSDACVDIYSRR